MPEIIYQRLLDSGDYSGCWIEVYPLTFGRARLCVTDGRISCWSVY